MSDTEHSPVVQNAEHVAHADRVDHAARAEVATVVGHADTITKVEVFGEPIRSNSVRRLRYIREIASWLIVLFALIVMVVVVIDENVNEDTLREQVAALQAQRISSDLLTSEKLECTRRYQDVIDAAIEEQLILIGEFLVVISDIVPGPDREAAVAGKAAVLDETNVKARAAVNAKVEYNNAGNPLPCPLVPTVAG